MTVIGLYGSAKPESWRSKLSQYLDKFTIFDLVSAEGEQADIALVWAPPAGQLAKMPNLRGIVMQGQGVDYMMADATVPRNVPLVRLVDPGYVECSESLGDSGCTGLLARCKTLPRMPGLCKLAAHCTALGSRR